MGVKWTPRQQQAIETQGAEILVSAAAGSGKTAVLVERVIQKILDPEHPQSIDRLLIVTFTKAAAAQMRERITEAIRSTLAEDPDNVHLQKQLTLAHQAWILTIDGFCARLVREHFMEIDLEPGFRAMDETECRLLREDVCDQVLEECYAEGDPAFLRIADGYAGTKNDRPLRDMILKIDTYADSYPWPMEWLDSCLMPYGISGGEDAAGQDGSDASGQTQWIDMPWADDLFASLRLELSSIIDILEETKKLCKEPGGPEPFEAALKKDQERYGELLNTLDARSFLDCLQLLKWDRLSTKKSEDRELRERVSKIRDDCKERVKAWKDLFPRSIEEEQELTEQTGQLLRTILQTVKRFHRAFQKAKRKRNVIDFSDMEHYALDILVDHEKGCCTQTAMLYREMFDEVIIDEYQDCNDVQEELFRAVSRGKRFMVGDVKQSIYRFRQARPEIFMQKYQSYSLTDGPERKIILDANFRSRPEILSFVNRIFEHVMIREIGGVEYDAQARLNAGRSTDKTADAQAKISYEPEIYYLTSDENAEERRRETARFIAARARALVEDQEIPGIAYRDIAVLLRSSSGMPVYAEAFADEGVPLIIKSKKGYFSAVEVQTALSMLQIIDNPNNDIALTAVLHTMMGFRSEELAQVRIAYPEEPFYRALRFYAAGDNALAKRLLTFFVQLEDFRDRAADLPVHELLTQVLEETGYARAAAALPDGKRRKANLDALIEKAIAYEKTSYRGLMNFNRYIDKIQKYEIDEGEAGIYTAADDAVQIMTIHGSKGLEYPVVFLAEIDRKINTQDSKKDYVLSPAYGIGLKYCSREEHIKRKLVFWQAADRNVNLDTMGEELRVLYVALTRAKEKLYLVGSGEEKDFQNLDGPLDSASYYNVFHAKNYLDWIVQACGKESVITGDSEQLQKRDRETIEKCVKKKTAAQKKSSDGVGKEDLSKVDAAFSWRYPYAGGKSEKPLITVSEIKRMQHLRDMDEEESGRLYAEEVPMPYVPRFIEKRNANAGAAYGTALHRFLELTDFAALDAAKPETVSAFIDAEKTRLAETGRIDADVLARLSKKKLSAFLSSPIAGRMAEADRAGKLKREQPFMMEIAANRVYPESSEGETILTQGIMDAFWEEDGRIVLLDYKTDVVMGCAELADRYRIQLEIYKEALARRYPDAEEIEAWIYSLHLMKEIKMK